MKSVFTLAFTIIFGLCSATSFGVGWGKNGVYKYDLKDTVFSKTMIEYRNIAVNNQKLYPTEDTNCFLKTYNIFVGSEYHIESAFINMETSDTDSYAALSVYDSFTDFLLGSKTFTGSGIISIPNCFEKDIYLTLELVGTNISVFSFGLKRVKSTIIGGGSFLIGPDICFYSETNVTVDFRLQIPSTLDVIVFDKYGTIIDYIGRQQYFAAGDVRLEWNPMLSRANTLESGICFIYIKAVSIENEVAEFTRRFRFIH